MTATTRTRMRAGIVAVCTATATLVGMTSLSASGAGGVKPPAPIAQPARGGGGGGGIKPSTPQIPADWPSAVAAPPGRLTGVAIGSASPHWVLGLIGVGDALQYTASVGALYAPAGFVSVGGSPYVLSNGTYTITFAMQPNDHAASSTIVAFQLQLN